MEPVKSVLQKLRRGEPFALRWRHFEKQHESLTCARRCTRARSAHARRPQRLTDSISDAAVKLSGGLQSSREAHEPESLVFSTWSGKPLSPNNVLRQEVFPVCEAVGLTRVT
jgi:hypothetical protein